MCVVSMVADHYKDKFYEQYPQPIFTPTGIFGVTREEFDALKKDVLEMKELLKKAKEYDEKNNEPDCEMEEKIGKLRAIAELVGVNLDDVLKKKS